MPARILIIVDPQNDFITGTLAVPGAVGAMDALCEYLRTNPDLYSLIIVTADQHPANHCSFSPCGGQWPVHCVDGQPGAEIYAPLAAELEAYPARWILIGKGRHADREEYSVFAAKANAKAIQRMLADFPDCKIDVCGLAGDYCVLATVADGIKLFGHEPFSVLMPYSPSIDGGARLTEFVKEIKTTI